ncbi:MAG TPA: hypothetical protein DGG95_16020 [Cytophagales bacterium]|nr:hypothetical protein [Cytophagales bacterium]
MNSFLEHRTRAENYPEIPLGRGPAANLVPYMKGATDLKRPLMVNSETVVRQNFGNEQYAKCATALNILRETVMGPELFDKAFKEYSQRWAFKHPKPADFFRSMEDASAVDLDWFWRGWYYSTDNVDMTVDKVKWFKVKTEKTNLEGKEKNVTTKDLATGNSDKAVNDFSNGPTYITVLPTNDRFYGEFRSRIDDKAIINKLEDKNIYEVTISNKGGLVMPVIIEWTYKDGSKEIDRIPAEIWRLNENKFTKSFAKSKEVVSVSVDPMKETTDVNTDDNVFPRAAQPSKFEELKKKSN